MCNTRIHVSLIKWRRAQLYDFVHATICNKATRNVPFITKYIPRITYNPSIFLLIPPTSLLFCTYPYIAEYDTIEKPYKFNIIQLVNSSSLGDKISHNYYLDLFVCTGLQKQLSYILFCMFCERYLVSKEFIPYH